MKMIMAIVNNDDANNVSSNLTKEGIQVTKLATTGGFLMAGNTTFLIGVQDDDVDRVVETIAKYSKKRKQIVPSSTSYGMGVYTDFPVEVAIGGATLFIMNVERFEKV